MHFIDAVVAAPRMSPGSATAEDPAKVWDAFLERSVEGQFQQTSMWAEAKAIEGWVPIRQTLVADGHVCGGFQLLVRRSRFGRIGYVSKGPVAGAGQEGMTSRLLQDLVEAVHAHRLAAVIVQPPDETRMAAEDFRRFGFQVNRLVEVITATWVIDLRCTMEEIRARMRRTTLLELKRALKRGLTIREGLREDLGRFFPLMLTTCQRQKTSPSPASEAAFHRLWEAFGSQFRLNLAELEGQALAGSVSIGFRDRLTFWKKGWSGAHADKHPNQLVMFEAIEWAHRQGYKMFDCVAMSRATAEAILAGAPLTEDQKRSRDFFLMGYGGRPVLLPDSWVYFRSRLARKCYQAAINLPFLTPLLRTLSPAG